MKHESLTEKGLFMSQRSVAVAFFSAMGTTESRTRDCA